MEKKTMKKNRLKWKKKNYIKYAKIDGTNKILEICKAKYNEETNRERSIISQASFCLTTISLLIASLLTLFGLMKEYEYTYIHIAFIFIVIILMFLITSLIFAFLSTWRHKHKYLPSSNDLIDAINENIIEGEECSYKNNMSLINTYNEVNESLDESNNKKIKSLMFSNILLYISFGLAVIFIIILVVI